jgi:hypothetical protein
LWTKGSKEIIPTEYERKTKNQALECYQSQLKMNWPHFQAVINHSEFYA